jgi:hypothetical protein
MNTNRQRRVRDAAIAAEHKNHGDNVRRVLEQARRNVRGGAPGGVRYSEPVETPALVYKTHEPSARADDRRSRQMRSEPTITASHSAAEGDDRWAGWERWLRAHLDNERVYTEAAIADAVRQLVDGTICGIDALDEKVLNVNRDLREEIRDLKHEVARLTSLLAEMRT